jgi:2'-5' RNA ligase
MRKQLTVALQLPPAIRDHALEQSKRVAAEHPVHFTLNNVSVFPHVTLYAAAFLEIYQAEVVQELTDLTVGQDPLVCRMSNVATHEGYLEINLAPSFTLSAVHGRIVERLSPLRTFLREPPSAYRMSFSDEQLLNIHDYGYADAFELFRPHVTLTRLIDPRVGMDVAKTIRWEMPTFTANALVLYEMGEHGTCTSLIQEFPFRKPAP